MKFILKKILSFFIDKIPASLGLALAYVIETRPIKTLLRLMLFPYYVTVEVLKHFYCNLHIHQRLINKVYKLKQTLPVRMLTNSWMSLKWLSNLFIMKLLWLKAELAYKC